MRITQIPGRAVDNWASRIYLATVTVTAVCATLTAVGVIDDARTGARVLGVVLCTPWQVVPALVLAVLPIEEHLLGYSFWAESPPALFEPLWLTFCLAAALCNAALISVLARAARARLPRPVNTLAPLVLTAMWIAVGVTLALDAA
ncbi:hypothetical protein ACIA8O_03655 [Kitasatospora sp. NPDC051853]|uniref:SCO4225 family membrane protein n=1 Tax=Kitasatospora sp. NPDC051853 TaxID=3364058 RepID=UPI0037B496F2